MSDSRDEATIDQPDVDVDEAKKDAGPSRDAGRDSGSTDSLPRDASTQDDTDFTQCADNRVEAERQPGGSNVVWVIDTSGSMDQEAALVQQNLNRFVEVIESAGLLDYRVVLVSERHFVNIPDPLGSDMTHFLYIEENVGSDEPLSDLLKRFPDYKDFLLPGAITHFVTVTDDESDITAEEFVQKMEANLGKTFRSHAIASPPGDTSGTGGLGNIIPGLSFGGCGGNYGSAARPGDRHSGHLLGERGILAALRQHGYRVQRVGR